MNLEEIMEEKGKSILVPLGTHKMPVKKYRRKSTLGYTHGIKTERMKIFWKPGYSPKDRMIKKTKIGSLVFISFKGVMEVGKVTSFHGEKFTVKMAKTNRLFAVPYNLYKSTILL